MKFISAVILILITLLSGIYTFDAGFVSDDFVLLDMAKNTRIIKVFTGNWLGEHGTGGFYRPIVSLSWKIDYWLYGDHASGFHLTNIIIHILVVLLAAQLVERIHKDGWVAFFTGTFFALHPVHTEAVAWISGRTDLVAALFYLMSLNLFFTIRTDQYRGCFLSFAALIAAILAMLSKEIAYTLPVVLVVLDRIDGNRNSERRYRSHFYVPYFTALIAILVIRYFTLGNMLGGYGAQKHLRFDGVIFSYIHHYIEWLITPFGVAQPRGSWLWIIAMLGIALLSIAAVMSPKLRIGMLWFWITLLPVLNICRPQYLYIPSLGFVWILAVLIRNGRYIDRTLSGDTARAIAFTVLFLTYLFQTLDFNKEWRHTGFVGQGIREVMLSRYPKLTNKRVIMINPPINRKIPIGVFQNGLTQALQLWYNDNSIDAKRIFASYQFTDADPERDIILRFDKGKIFELPAGKTQNNFNWSDFPESISLKPLGDPVQIKGLQTDVKGLIIQSQLANAGDFENDIPVVDITVNFQQSPPFHYQMKTGRDTSEWAYDRPDVRENIKHQRAPIAFSYISGEPDTEPFAGHTYQTTVTWNHTANVTSIEFKPIFHPSEKIGIEPVIEIRNLYGLR